MATVVQSLGGQSSGAVATLAKTFGSNNTAGNVIIAIVQSDGGKVTGTGNILDTQLNSYTRIVQNSGYMAIFRALNCAAGANIVTYTPDSGTDYCALSIAEVSLLDASPDDGSNTNSATGIEASSGIITTTRGGIIFGVFTRHAAETCVVTDTHTDIFNSGNSYSSVNGATGYEIFAAATTDAMLWGGANSVAYDGAIAAFKNASADELGKGRGLNRRLRGQAIKRASFY